MITTCLFCGHSIPIRSNAKPGDLLNCSQCKTVFHLTQLKPVQIDWLQMRDDTERMVNSGETDSDELVQ